MKDKLHDESILRGSPPGSSASADAKPWGDWGGFEGEFGGHFTTAFLTFFVPTIPFLLYRACTDYDCSVVAPLQDLAAGRWTLAGLWAGIPPATPTAWAGFALFIAFQVALYFLLPGQRTMGLPTPAGNVLPYKINALAATLVTIGAFFLGSYGLNLFPATFVYDNYGPLITVGTISGFVFALLAYLKGVYAPTNRDASVHGQFFYDFWMGVELNPRIGNFDIKMFSIGRIGMIGWAIVNLSHAAKQYELYGQLSNSMVLLQVLQMIYIIDWAWKEAWYTQTLDIMHDHYGFFMAYGSTCWVLTIYTSQAWFLVHHPNHLSAVEVTLILGMNILGYTLFRLTNDEKTAFRASKGKVTIWGKPARAIEAVYKTADGQERHNLLLASGFWSLSRHFNYLCDLFITASFCMCGGFSSVIPWTYQVMMTWLLLDRANRDDRRCRSKYGKAWNQYCKEVPYIIIPGVY